MPNAYNSQTTTQTTTTALRIFLIFPSIGIYVLTNQSNTPTTIRVTTREISDIRYLHFEQPFFYSPSQPILENRQPTWGVTLPCIQALHHHELDHVSRIVGQCLSRS